MKADVVVVKVEPGEVVEAGQVFLRDESSTIHMGPEDPSNRKKYPSFLSIQFVGSCKTIPKM